MKKTYKAPKTLVCEGTEIFCDLGVTSNPAIPGQDGSAHGRKDDFDDEDLW